MLKLWSLKRNPGKCDLISENVAGQKVKTSSEITVFLYWQTRLKLKVFHEKAKTNKLCDIIHNTQKGVANFLFAPQTGRRTSIWPRGSGSFEESILVFVNIHEQRKADREMQLSGKEDPLPGTRGTYFFSNTNFEVIVKNNNTTKGNKKTKWLRSLEATFNLYLSSKPLCLESMVTNVHIAPITDRLTHGGVSPMMMPTQQHHPSEKQHLLGQCTRTPGVTLRGYFLHCRAPCCYLCTWNEQIFGARILYDNVDDGHKESR